MSEGKENRNTLDDFLVNNQKSIVITAVVLILLSGALYYNNNFRKPKKEKEANIAAAKAEFYFGMDSIDLALNGDGQSAGLIDLASEYSSTKTGDRATYLAGAALLKKGQPQEALDYLEKADFSDDIVAPLSLVLIGDCYSELENYDKAASKYMKAADLNDNRFTAPYALLKAAKVYMSQDKWGDAYKAFKRIEDDYKDTRFGQDIEKWVEMARVKAEE